MQLKTPSPAARVPLLVIDQDEARRYLAGVRDLAAEAVASPDPRVVLCALRVLELAPASIRRIWAHRAQTAARHVTPRNSSSPASALTTAARPRTVHRSAASNFFTQSAICCVRQTALTAATPSANPTRASLPAARNSARN
jgi:hypothetical protein